MGKKGENTRQLICNVAEKLFSEKGYTAVSMQMICDETGLSKGGLYRHFRNKEELLLELIKKEKKVFNDIEAGKSATETLERYFILLENTALLQNLLKLFFPTGNYGFYAADASRLKKCFEDICSLLKKRKPDDAMLSAMAFCLLQEASFQQPRSMEPLALSQALLYVENHFCERELDRERIAAAAGVSISTLQRLFKKYKHCPAAEYITSLRMQKARHLLEYTHESVASIAEKCGYSYSYYFAREFRKSFGCTPKEYRQKNGK